MPVEYLRNLVVTPSCCWSRGEQSRLEPVLAGLPCQQTGFTVGKQPVLAERYVQLFSLRAVGCLHKIL